jgi:hypothetical protein
MKNKRGTRNWLNGPMLLNGEGNKVWLGNLKIRDENAADIPILENCDVRGCGRQSLIPAKPCLESGMIPEHTPAQQDDAQQTQYENNDKDTLHCVA